MELSGTAGLQIRYCERRIGMTFLGYFYFILFFLGPRSTLSGMEIIVNKTILLLPMTVIVGICCAFILVVCLRMERT